MAVLLIRCLTLVSEGGVSSIGLLTHIHKLVFYPLSDWSVGVGYVSWNQFCFPEFVPVVLILLEAVHLLFDGVNDVDG